MEESPKSFFCRLCAALIRQLSTGSNWLCQNGDRAAYQEAHSINPECTGVNNDKGSWSELRLQAHLLVQKVQRPDKAATVVATLGRVMANVLGHVKEDCFCGPRSRSCCTEQRAGPMPCALKSIAGA